MMRTFALAITVLLMAGAAMAGRPTPTAVDTINTGGTGRPEKFVATWRISLSATPDTIDLPAPAGIIDLVHRGSAAGTDTVYESLAQAPHAGKFSVLLNVLNTSYRYDARGPYIRRVILKANGTVPVWLVVNY